MIFSAAGSGRTFIQHFPIRLLFCLVPLSKRFFAKRWTKKNA
jgi:hypothetical protein